MGRGPGGDGKQQTRFRGPSLVSDVFSTGSEQCDGCPNRCEVVSVSRNGEVIARWGDVCGRHAVEDGGAPA